MKGTDWIMTALLLVAAGFGLGVILNETAVGASPSDAPVMEAAGGQYVVIGWNDLGMHCISPRFREMAILPPYNTLMVQVIKRGNPPRIITAGLNVRYSIVDNTTVTGKTDFWKYDFQLFGVDLPRGIGLTGNGLSGRMKAAGDHFEATGIPVLPFTDDMVWSPYQKALIRVKDAAGTILAQTYAVLPVSDEMHCKKCHRGGGDAAPDIDTGTVEGNILTLHDRLQGTNLMAGRPVLCAGCHSDNALGAPGEPGVSSLSKAMHVKHSSVPGIPACYDCHPGPKTRCNRSAIYNMGPLGNDPNCSACHGTFERFADSLRQGREPWLQEPKCTYCHDRKYSTGQNLYRNARGHGGLFCSACHNSPHAWWPSRNAMDNYQPKWLQGEAESIGRCTVCHLTGPGGEVPH